MANPTNPNTQLKNFKNLIDESPAENTPQEQPIQHQLDMANTTVGGLTRLLTQDKFSHKHDIKGLKKARIIKVEREPKLFVGHLDRKETNKLSNLDLNNPHAYRYKVSIRGSVGDINSETIYYDDLATWFSPDYIIDSTIVEPPKEGDFCYVDFVSHIIVSVEANNNKDIGKYKSKPTDLYTAKRSFKQPSGNLPVSLNSNTISTPPQSVGTKKILEQLAIKKHGQEFLDKVVKITSNLNSKLKPEWLLAVMQQESGMNPKAINSINAVGLIQFIPQTATKVLNTTTENLLSLNAIQQLDWVEKYYMPYKQYLTSPGSLYLATFYPNAFGKPDDYIIGSENGKSQLIRNQNFNFDLNNDGVITLKEFNEYCEKRFGGL